MGRKYVKNGKKVNKHGIPIGIRDIEEIVDEAERKEQKQEVILEETERKEHKQEVILEEPKKEYKRKEFLERIIVKPDPNYRKKLKENIAKREKAVEIERQRFQEGLKKAIEGMQEREIIESEQDKRIEILKSIEEKRKSEGR